MCVILYDDRYIFCRRLMKSQGYTGTCKLRNGKNEKKRKETERKKNEKKTRRKVTKRNEKKKTKRKKTKTK